MAEERLQRISVKASALPARARWAEGMAFSLPERLARLMEAGAPLDDPAVTSQMASAAERLRLRAAYVTSPPVSSRLPVSYRNVPAVGRLLFASAMGRLQRLRQSSWSRYPGWPIDLSADFAADLAGRPGVRFTQTPVLLTHDIDSDEGLENLVRLFLPIEESAGARSANYVVPCAWPLDHGLLAEAKQRGHEIGIHGFDHSNVTAFASPHERRARLTGGRELALRYGAQGYRAPSLLRSAALLQDLAAYYRYDSSIPTSGGPFPVPNSGCATARPWRIGTLWELPLTLPRDGSLRFLGHSAAQIAALWRSTAGVVAQSGGIVCLLTHCEAGFSGNKPMLAAYRSFIEWIAADPRFRFARPADLVAELEAAFGAPHERAS
jgi:peptidoglycan/xylan/chitin deacetylase (PgdA/CDA1 family)